MVSLGIVCNGDKETVLKAITLLRQIAGLRIIFIKQSNLRLFIITEDTYNIVKDFEQGVNNELSQVQ